MKIHSINPNNPKCPDCGELLKYCTCEDNYPESDLLDLDDELSFSAIDFQL